jgi:opacity protein-like surface antigen
MRIASFVITAALATGLSGTAFAQTTAQPAQAAPTATYGSDQVDNWFASAYLGSTFGGGGSTFFENDVIDRGSTAALNLGGEIGYAWNGKVGAEFMANHSPNFEVEDVLFQRRPSINTYMVNALVAVPAGDIGNVRPFVSGGIGAVQMRSTIFTIDPTTTLVDINSLDTETLTHSQFGWNLGGGLMAFQGAWGLRADVRYFRATTDNNLIDSDTLRDALIQRQLSGLSFWNANFGIAFKW